MALRWWTTGALLCGLALGAGCEDRPAGAPGASGSGDEDAGILCGAPEEGCPCEPEAEPAVCYLPAEPSAEGFTCYEGVRYCRGGRWSGCESVRTYTLHTPPTALVTGPDACNPCNPDCATNVDQPNDGDLTPANSSGVEYDPGEGGITLVESGPTGGSLTDTDGDGVPDVADDYPTDPGRWHSEDDDGFFHVLPYGGPSEFDPLEFTTQVTTADVYLLIDTTGSMGGELRNLKRQLTSGSLIGGCSGGLLGAIRCTIPDAWFGVGHFDDYPVFPYGTGVDQVYRNHLDITSDLSAAQSAVNALPIHNGYDWPESQTQALYAVATGNGLDRYLSARGSCGGGRWGYPCFRPDTIPIVVLITDAPFHNGPNTAYGYGSIGGAVYCCRRYWWFCARYCSRGRRWTPPGWSTVVSALNARDIKVITVESSGGYADARSNAVALANATGSVDMSRNPYVYSIPSWGTGLSAEIVRAIENLANSTRYDVSARAADNPSTTIDERGFVESITALGYGPGDCLGGCAGSACFACTPGTNVDFQVEFRNDFVMPTTSPQVFDFYIEVLLDGSAQHRVPVRIVVPAEVPTYPPSGYYEREYDANDFCTIPPQRPDWGTFTWDAETPSDTRIRFEFRLAETAAELDGATPVSITVPPQPDAGSVDVGSLFLSSGIIPSLPHLRVTSVLISSSDRTQAPVLRRFEMQYTCYTSE